MKCFLQGRKLATAFCSLSAISSATAAAPSVDFQRDIQPILAKHCYHCHGPDAASRKADLRLDLKDSLLGTPQNPGVVQPHHAEESSLIQRVISQDPEEQMPPPDHPSQLSEDEKSKLLLWVKEGAPYQGHWSWNSPRTTEVSKLLENRPRSIDAFIEVAWKPLGLVPSPPASPEALLRRVTLDLTGLLPSPEALNRFLAAPSQEAYEREVDRLLASPAFGEHRARYWLDAARYADTHGLHFDNYREIWPYRDWVIRAFNQNLPFDQFTIEQLAGDLLPNPTSDQKIATGFQRCNMTTNEGGTIDEENLALYAADRIQTFGWVYLGMTLNCAQCHDHKFDPVTAQDYYALSAFFQNTTQPAKDGNVKGNGAMLTLPKDADFEEHQKLSSRLTQLHQRWEQLQKRPVPETPKLEPGNLLKLLQGSLPKDDLQLWVPFHDGVTSHDRGLHYDSHDSVYGQTQRIKKPVPVEGAAPKISVREPFSVSVWLKADRLEKAQTVVSHMDHTAQLRGWDLYLDRDRVVFHLIDRWPDEALRVNTVAGVLLPKMWHHVTLQYHGTASPEGVELYVDGKKVEVRGTQRSLKPTSIVTHAQPLLLGGRAKQATFQDGLVQDLRIFSRLLHDDEIQMQVAAGKIAQNISQALHVLTPPKFETQALESWLRFTLQPEYASTLREQGQVARQLQKIDQRSPITLVQEERTDQMPQAHVLKRGQYDQLGELVQANTPVALLPMQPEWPKNRLGLAKWLVDPAHPLTARVTVNRFWQELFGTGLVATPDDFGIMGAPPSHPELLDWLAVDFMDSGWDVKRLFRQMVTSQAYQRSAQATQESRLKDPENRWLSRGPRFRMDAEMIRDSALQASGLLVETFGGPSIKPFQPPGIWDVVGLPNGDTRNYVQDQGPNQYRRSVYQFWKRMSPPPNLETFNAPSREFSCLRRERTNTPMQALVLLNDPQFIQAAIHLAAHVLPSSDPLQQLSLRTLGRPCSSQEKAILKPVYDAALDHFTQNLEAQKSWLAHDVEQVAPRSAELAAWSFVAQQFLNLDEFISK